MDARLAGRAAALKSGVRAETGTQVSRRRRRRRHPVARVPTLAPLTHPHSRAARLAPATPPRPPAQRRREGADSIRKASREALLKAKRKRCVRAARTSL